MKKFVSSIYFILSLYLSLIGHSNCEDNVIDGTGSSKVDSSPKKIEPAEPSSINFSVPKLNDEETQSNFLPFKNDAIKCDSCHGISFQMDAKFTAVNNKLKKYNFNLPESEILELFEEICDQATFKSYGVKEMDGIKRISGLGTGAESYNGMMHGGGRWPQRIAALCNQVVDELDESKIYANWLKNRNDYVKFRDFICVENGTKSFCKIENNDDILKDYVKYDDDDDDDDKDDHTNEEL